MITPVRAAGTCRSAVKIITNGISVPITATPSASRMFSTSSKKAHGNVHGGCTIKKSSVQKPMP